MKVEGRSEEAKRRSEGHLHTCKEIALHAAINVQFGLIDVVQTDAKQLPSIAEALDNGVHETLEKKKAQTTAMYVGLEGLGFIRCEIKESETNSEKLTLIWGIQPFEIGKTCNRKRLYFNQMFKYCS